MSDKGTLVLRAWRKEIDPTAAYQADVCRHRITYEHDGHRPVPGIYWEPSVNHPSIPSNRKSGTVAITYSNSRRPAMQPPYQHNRNSPRTVGAQAQPAWDYGQDLAGSANQAGDRQSVIPMSFFYGGLHPLSELYTVHAEFASWTDETMFRPEPDLGDLARCSRLAIDSGCSDLWTVGRNFRKLIWDDRRSRFTHHSWTPEDRNIYVNHHQAVNLEVDLDSSLPHSAVTSGDRRIDSSHNGQTLRYKDGSAAAVSYYKNAFRVYGLQKDDETFETLELGSFHVGIAYAVDQIAASRHYDGILGVGRQRQPNGSMFVVESLMLNHRIQRPVIYFRFLPREDVDNQSFIAFGEWPVRATYTPLFRKVKLVIVNEHEDMWVVWLAKMELQVGQHTYEIEVLQNMILDTGCSSSFVNRTAMAQLQDITGPEISERFFDNGNTTLALHFGGERAGTQVIIRVHVPRFLLVRGGYSEGGLGNYGIHERDGSKPGVLGMNFFHSAFVGFHAAMPGVRPFVQMADYNGELDEYGNVKDLRIL